MRKNRKLLILSSLVIFMLSYIITVFYLSEPKYIDNNENKVIAPYDYVNVLYKKNSYSAEYINVMVLQIDANFVLVKTDGTGDYNPFGRSDEYIRYPRSGKFYIVGRGTIYHKINGYVGFNIMFITQAFLLVLLFITSGTVFRLTRDLLE